MGDNHAVEISGIGTIKLKMYDGLIRTISGVRHVKDLKKNLLSVGQFDSLGCKIRTDNGIMKIVKGALVVLKARKTVANMFVLMGETHQGAEASIASASPAEEKTMMWHQKLGHMSEKGLKVLSDQKLLPGLTKETIEVQIENTQNHTSSEVVPEHEEQEQIESETPEVRRSTRERRPPAWHSEYVTESNIAYFSSLSYKMDSSEKMNSIDPYMDPVLYKAAEEGNIDPFENYQTCLNQLLTPDENTILHVYLGNQSREPEFTDFVDIILEMCPPLLLQANKKGETPLHLAARYGHSKVVKVLIYHAKALPSDPESGVTEAKKMLRMTTEEQDTALHEAARNMWSHVVEILTKEDPELSYSANVHGETPLYIAASSWGNFWVIDEILTNCISVDFGGPNGITALHAAIRLGDRVIARKLLEKEKKLTKTTDENGWSPLHYAAYYDWYARPVEVLLECDASAAYIAETEKERTALHIAAIRGRVDVMKEIVSRCPACCELVDNRGWNALHYVVASKDRKVFLQCLEIPELARLGTKKDEKGNTPFHLIAALAHEQKQWRRVLYESKIPELCGLNKRKLSVDDIYFGNLGEIQVINPLRINCCDSQYISINESIKSQQTGFTLHLRFS
ncbi:hypothetical protein POTOM_059607 [Populus tomentosa]|uniref:Ankyrin repeat family protein n=1 Tax=Populus tomentosa TaxID=118781 RepID=A0A8X7XTB2_POPTO|nr:hypothetical protein POTOM_059607 [Populus tomentosa]